MHCPFNKSQATDVCSLPIESCYVQFDVVSASNRAIGWIVSFVVGSVAFATAFVYFLLRCLEEQKPKKKGGRQPDLPTEYEHGTAYRRVINQPRQFQLPQEEDQNKTT